MSLENSERVMSTAVNERLYSSDYERENKINNVTSQFPCPLFIAELHICSWLSALFNSVRKL